MRTLGKLSDEALAVLCSVTIEAEEHAPEDRALFWQWLRACTWQEWTRRHQPARATAEPGFPALTAEEMDHAAGALVAMIDHEEQKPTDDASPALAALFSEIGSGLALMRRNVPAASETRH